GALLQRLGEPPREYLAQRGEVVSAGDGADAEALVVVLSYIPVLPHDHRADLLGPLDVGDVVALDAIGGPRQAERAAQLLQDVLLAIVPRQQMVLQRDGRVGLGHRHELAPCAALRRGQRHAPPGQAGEPLGDELSLGDRLGEEQLGGRGHRLAVELAHEGREDLAVAPSRHLVEEERLLADQPPLAYEEKLDAGVRSLAHHADHVLVDLLGGDDLLAFPDLVEDRKSVLFRSPTSRPLRTKNSSTQASDPWRTTPITSWSTSSVEMIFWRSRTLL